MSDFRNLTELEDDAFALLMAQWEAASPDQQRQAQHALDVFARQSAAHRQALTNARADWELMAFAQPQSSHKPVTRYWQQPALLALAACVLLCALLTPLWLPHNADTPLASATPSSWSEKFSSGREQQIHALPDGSEVVLNWNTDLRIDFRSDVRHVYLNRGEALFRVAKDKSRPFIVHAGETDARAVGTEFRVRYINRKEAEVAVSEGVVAVSATGQPALHPANSDTVTLTMSQTLRTGSEDYPRVRQQSLAEMTAWTHGRLVFEERPLHEVLQEISRYTDYRIVTDLLPDPQAKVTATYFIAHTNEAMDSLLQLFHLQGEFRQNRGGTDLILRPARPAALTL